MKGNETYRLARTCANCYWSDLMFFGSKVGYYCKKYKGRCSKRKVCDSHLTESEAEIFHSWPAVTRHFGDL